MTCSKSTMRTHSNDLFSDGLHLVYVNIGYEIRCYINSNSLSRGRFIINSLSATTSNPALGARHDTSYRLFVYQYANKGSLPVSTPPKLYSLQIYCFLYQHPLIAVLGVAGHLNLPHLLAISWIISLFYMCYYIPAYFHVLVASNIYI